MGLDLGSVIPTARTRAFVGGNSPLDSENASGRTIGTNLYAYVRGSPIGLQDPNGMQPTGGYYENKRFTPNRPPTTTEQVDAILEQAGQPSARTRSGPTKSEQVDAILEKYGAPPPQQERSSAAPGSPQVAVPFAFADQPDPDMRRYQVVSSVKSFESTGSDVLDAAYGALLGYENIARGVVNTASEIAGLPFYGARKAGLGEGDVAALEVFSVAGPGVFAGVPGAFAGVLEGLQAAGRSYLSERQLAAALKADLAAAEAGPKLRGTIREVSIAKLEELSKAGGETVELFTKLDTKLEGDRELFVAIGEGAEDLAAAARTEGQVHRATVPKAVIDELRAAGLVQEGTLTMKGASGTELRFLPEAATYVLKFFN